MNNPYMIQKVNEIGLQSEEHKTLTILGKSCSNFVKGLYSWFCTLPNYPFFFLSRQ